MPPKVQTLAQSMAALAPGYNEQRELINEQISGLGAMYDAQRESLEGTRSQAFNRINDQALGRGVGAAFSGIPLHEQAQYLSNEFLPGMQRLAVQENQERMQYRTQIAQMNTAQQNAALGRIDQQQAALNQWNLQQAQLEAQRRENELNRQFQASQARSAQVSSLGQAQAAQRAALNILTAPGAQGKDKKVSPSTFQKALNAYVNAGGSPNDFRNLYSGYANIAGHGADYGYF